MTQDIRGQGDARWERTEEKLAPHIMKAYLLGLIEIESEDRLLEMYYENIGDEVRAHSNFWLSKVLQAQRPEEDDTTWQRIWELWKTRLGRASTAKERGRYSEEMTSYCRLLEWAPVGLEDIYGVLMRTLEFDPGEYEVQLMINYLGRNCGEHPELAISGLHKLLFSNLSFYMTKETKGFVRKILDAASTGNRKTKDLAIEVVNILGERGDYEWRPMLESLA